MAWPRLQGWWQAGLEGGTTPGLLGQPCFHYNTTPGESWGSPKPPLAGETETQQQCDAGQSTDGFHCLQQHLLSQAVSPGSLPPHDSLFLAAGPVPGTEKQAAGDQVELHAAAEVLLEQHRAPFRGLHLHPSEAAGLLDRGPRPAGVRVPLPP